MRITVGWLFWVFTVSGMASAELAAPLPEGFDGVHLGMDWASLISLRKNLQVLSLMPDNEEALKPDPETPREGLTERLAGEGPFDTVLYAFDRGHLVGVMFGKDIQPDGREREQVLRFVVEKCGKPSRIALLEEQGHHRVWTWRDQVLHVNLIIPTDTITAEKQSLTLQMMDRDYAKKVSAPGSPPERTKRELVLSDLPVDRALEILSASTGIAIGIGEQLQPLPDLVLPMCQFGWEEPCEMGQLEEMVRLVLRCAGLERVSVEEAPGRLTFLRYDAEREVMQALAKGPLADVIRLSEAEPTVPAFLVRVVADRTQPERVRWRAVRALTQGTHREILLEEMPLWTSILQDEREPARLREEVIAALEKLGTREAADRLISVLEDPSEGYLLRMRAARALGEIGDPAACPALIRILQAPSSDPASFAIIRSLGRLGDESALEVLTAIAEDEAHGPRVREETLTAIDLIELRTTSPSSLEAARRALMSERDRVRSWGIQIIGQHGDAGDVEALREVLRSAKAAQKMGLYTETVNALKQLGIDVRREGLLGNSLYLQP